MYSIKSAQHNEWELYTHIRVYHHDISENQEQKEHKASKDKKQDQNQNFETGLVFSTAILETRGKILKKIFSKFHIGSIKCKNNFSGM